MTTFQELLAANLIKPGLTITGGGVRYGSVIYLGFGDTWTESLRGQGIRRFAVELEFGADVWLFLVDGIAYLSSDRPDLYLERDEIDQMLIGGQVLSTSSDLAHFDLTISGGIVIRSVVETDQASGFLLTLSLPNESFETLNGETLVL